MTKKTKIKTELGMEIEAKQSHKDAEYLAGLKEAIEDNSDSLKRGLEKLLDQMRMDKISACTVLAPKGSIYKFEVYGRETRVKIKHAVAAESTHP